MTWVGIAVAAVGAYASAADKYADEVSLIPTLQRGPHGTPPCGWECSGCKATNAASAERCIWCRSYRVAPMMAEQAPSDSALVQATLVNASASAAPFLIRGLNVYSIPHGVDPQDAVQFFNVPNEDQS